MLENLVRLENGRTVSVDDIKSFGRHGSRTRALTARSRSARRACLMQDLTGVPAVVDLAAMRAAMVDLGGDPKRSTRCRRSISSSTIRCRSTISAPPRPLPRTSRSSSSERRALSLSALGPGRVREFPPGAAGHRHLPPGQLEYLAQVVWTPPAAGGVRPRSPIPTSLSGTDSQTRRWSTGCPCSAGASAGIEAEAAMLGQPIPC